MARLCIHKDNLGKILNYLHPNIVSNIESYKEGSFYLFPSYHSCFLEIEMELEKKNRYHQGESVSILYI